MILGIIRVAAAAVLLASPFTHASNDKENEVKNILQRIEKDTLKLRDEIEIAYSKRCSIETLSQCSQSSFNGCSSVFPNQQCMEPNELVIEACAGGGGTCNALWDKTTSTVSIPSALAQGKNNNPLDPELIETACYTLLAEDYMRTKYENDEIFWDSYNVQPSWTYFGAHNGLFRKLPASAQEECGNYDPRKRPWFVAASSGPKDVVIVLDVSGSMSNFGRLDLAKKAAITVVETLTISDRVAIIAFSDYAYQVHSGTDMLVRATNENKQILIEQIQALTEGGATNFHAGFQQAFYALERTIEQEYTSGCNVAILFMTDGVNTAGPETDEVLQLIKNGTQRLATQYDRDTKIFTFSLGTQADRSATKEIACSTNGIWTPVDDFDGDLVGAMASYYKLFASGLGNETDFTTWVEPYEFFSSGEYILKRRCNPRQLIGNCVSHSY